MSSARGGKRGFFVVSAKRLKLPRSAFAAGAFGSHGNIFMTTLANDLIVVQRRIIAHGAHGGQFHQAVVVSTLDGPVSFQSGRKSTACGSVTDDDDNDNNNDTTPVVSASVNSHQWFRILNLTQDGAGAAGGCARASACS